MKTIASLVLMTCLIIPFNAFADYEPYSSTDTTAGQIVGGQSSAPAPSSPIP